ncbi:hypothetical protein PM082_001214 [Marasmius tenuissimus]|nr:hypothetical protein PM082_001214 [Marasmius tenuissimus]
MESQLTIVVISLICRGLDKTQQWKINIGFAALNGGSTELGMGDITSHPVQSHAWQRMRGQLGMGPQVDFDLNSTSAYSPLQHRLCPTSPIS